MTQRHATEVPQTTIVISNTRKDQLATAMSDARATMERTAHTTWEPFTETPAQQRARLRAERIARLVDAL